MWDCCLAYNIGPDVTHQIHIHLFWSPLERSNVQNLRFLHSQKLHILSINTSKSKIHQQLCDSVIWFSYPWNHSYLYIGISGELSGRARHFIKDPPILEKVRLPVTMLIKLFSIVCSLRYLGCNAQIVENYWRNCIVFLLACVVLTNLPKVFRMEIEGFCLLWRELSQFPERCRLDSTPRSCFHRQISGHCEENMTAKKNSKF